jgi:uncharacterized membrane-anchored protein YhcB (DUF1043 family)
MEFAFIFLALIVIGYLILHKTNTKLKQTSKKKEEILEEYTKELQTILNKASTPEEKTQRKKEYLQKCNSELSRNIFFTKDEATKALQKLASL